MSRCFVNIGNLTRYVNRPKNALSTFSLGVLGLRSYGGGSFSDHVHVPVIVYSPLGEYVIKKGDTMYNVALSHGIKMAELRQLNNLDKTATLSVGQKVKVPKVEPILEVVEAPVEVVQEVIITTQVSTPPSSFTGEWILEEKLF
jgi:hypothetical protein